MAYMALTGRNSSLALVCGIICSEIANMRDRQYPDNQDTLIVLDKYNLIAFIIYMHIFYPYTHAGHSIIPLLTWLML